MYYTIYKTTNKLNGKFYLGKHQTTKLDDLYYGSGKAIKDAIKKYGIENFDRELLFIFDNEAEMNMKEKELITEEFVKREDTYNLGVGGEGGPHFKGKKHSLESIRKLSESRKNYTHTEETRSKIADANKKRIWTPEMKANLSAAVKKRYAKNQIAGKCSGRTGVS